jgi:hypothetical protein
LRIEELNISASIESLNSSIPEFLNLLTSGTIPGGRNFDNFAHNYICKGLISRDERGAMRTLTAYKYRDGVYVMTRVQRLAERRGICKSESA